MGGVEKIVAIFAIYHKNSKEDSVQKNIHVPYTGPEYVKLKAPSREPN